MKGLTAIFAVGVVGVVISLGMSIYTGIKIEHERANPPPVSIPLPAVAK